jgi:adenylate kinase
LFVVLLGLPGAGKGTQAARLARELGVAHVTTGEIFRENIRDDTELGRKAKPFVENGKLVPDEITIGMLLDRISQADCVNGCLLDGFPRNTEQAKALDEALDREGKRIDRVVYIRVGQDELITRLAGRWSCPKCGAVFHQVNQPPKREGVCDNCGSALVQRKDDTPAVVKTRLEVNMEQLQPMLEYYGEQHKLSDVDGARNVEVVLADLMKVIA